MIIDPHPVNTTVKYGDTAMFQCHVASDIQPTIQVRDKTTAMVKPWFYLVDITTLVVICGENWCLVSWAAGRWRWSADTQNNTHNHVKCRFEWGKSSKGTLLGELDCFHDQFHLESVFEYFVCGGLDKSYLLLKTWPPLCMLTYTAYFWNSQ